MTPTTLAAALARLGWTQRIAAHQFARKPAVIRQWLNGDVPIPPEVAAWLNHLLAWLTRHPPPQG